MIHSEQLTFFLDRIATSSIHRTRSSGTSTSWVATATPSSHVSMRTSTALETPNILDTGCVSRSLLELADLRGINLQPDTKTIAQTFTLEDLLNAGPSLDKLPLWVSLHLLYRKSNHHLTLVIMLWGRTHKCKLMAVCLSNCSVRINEK